MCFVPSFEAGTGGAGTQVAGFPIAMLFPLLENYRSSVLLLGKLSQVKTEDRQPTCPQVTQTSRPTCSGSESAAERETEIQKERVQERNRSG